MTFYILKNSSCSPDSETVVGIVIPSLCAEISPFFDIPARGALNLRGQPSLKSKIFHETYSPEYADSGKTKKIFMQGG